MHAVESRNQATAIEDFNVLKCVKLGETVVVVCSYEFLRAPYKSDFNPSSCRSLSQ
jgi:hypothetical protein